MSQLELIQIQKKYENGFTAMHSFDLQVEKHEFIALLGPSGCGKSTLLRMIAGLEEISAGTLKINGQRMNEVAPQHRDIAMVFQSYALYPHLNAYDNIAFGLRLKGMKETQIRERIEDLAQRLELQGVLTRKPKEMSGGQRQRIAIARALAKQASLLLFDEPLSNLDTQLRTQMRIEIAKIHREFKATTLYVTHDQVEAMTLATRIVLLKNGNIQQIGTPLSLYHQPANRFVAAFIGQPSMNLFPLSIDEKLCFYDEFHQIKLQPPAEFRERYQSVLQQHSSIIIGIRADDISILIQSQSPSTSQVVPSSITHDFCEIRDLQIDLIEPLGNENLIYASKHQLKLIIKQDRKDRLMSIGQSISISFPFTATHLFQNDEIGQRICD